MGRSLLARHVLVLATVMAVLGAAVPVGALTITINDLTDTVMVTSDSSATTAVKDPIFPEFVTISDPGIPRAARTLSVELIEPGLAPGPVFTRSSDSIRVDSRPSAAGKVFFLSDRDPEGPFFDVICGGLTTCLEETGLPQDVAPFLFPGAANLHIFVISDREPVPEPTTLLLLGFGLAGLVGVAWKKGRSES